MKYLTVGTGEITRELFRPVRDVSGQTKPIGGLWLTKYNELYKNYNEWIEYLINNPTILFYMSRNYSMWKQPCSLVTLKEQANLFYLKNNRDLEYFGNNYDFSYQQISHIYDGIFIDIFNLIKEVNSYEVCKALFKFSVNSLILFNLDCIDYYQSGKVLITPFDLESKVCETPTYEIKIDDVKKKILKKL